MANTKAFKVKNGLDLGAYSKAISDTAVDIFVYDTRKDSDGGAWRKRTQGTSWYNETLSTATRGSRKEFPAVAVIVVNSDTGQNLPHITIYDGDDPDLPMWMEFTRVSQDSYLNSYTNGATMVGNYPVGSAFAKNGVLALGSTRSAGALNGLNAGLRVINFVSDSAIAHSNTDAYVFPNDISQRDSLVDAAATSGAIVNVNVNDVAMTVLPNAPIDAATGLPVPTIAVATDGGVSVIKDDGTVVDIVHSDSALTPNVWLDGDTIVYNAHNFLHARKIPSTDVSAGLRYAAHSADLWFAPRFYYPTVYSLGNFDLHPTGGSVYDIIQKDNFVAVRGSDRLTLASLSGNQERVANDASYAWITSSYNTGWMNGDIKLATLSDTDDTNVTGSELVTNGTFDSDVSGWTAGDGATVTHQSGRMRVDGNVGTANQAITTVVGKSYTVSADLFLGTSASAAIYISNTTSSAQAFTSFSYPANSVTFIATSTTTYIVVRVNAASNTYIEVDNISARLAEEDRSVNGNGLQVFGTVTKSAVATGADLVAYSGFSTSNKLIQPYNSDLDFGTGDFCYMAWVKTVSNSNNNSIVARGVGGSTAGFVYLSVNGDGFLSAYVSSSSVASSLVVPTGVWTHCAVIRRGSNVYGYVNGVEDHINSNAATVTNSSAILIVGNSSYGQDLPTTSSIALLRISATAPSPEQIKKIYEDEKVLFQENAKAVLYGSSDAVTALAYDDTTELLHAGTSAGRSVFQGLRRVDNTTTAVGAAISASNGLVADE